MPEGTRDEIEVGTVAAQMTSAFNAMRDEIYALRGNVMELEREIRQLRAQNRQVIKALRVEPALLDQALGSGD